MNACSGIVASFNLQGAAWSRSLRKYALHDKDPAPLSVAVSPLDLPSYQVARCGFSWHWPSTVYIGSAFQVPARPANDMKHR